MRELAPDVIERNYGKDPLTRSEAEEIVRAAGGVAAVLNTRHKTAKENGWSASPPGVAEFAKALAAEPNLLRRPVILNSGRAIVTRDETELRAFLT